ncbi:hypothetical protein AVEN_132111-2-1, partial [Araneus ventricosus]
ERWELTYEQDEQDCMLEVRKDIPKQCVETPEEISLVNAASLAITRSTGSKLRGEATNH